MVSLSAAVRLALVALVATTAGCAFDSPVTVRFSGASPVEVTESFAPEQTPHRVHGRTTRAAQIVRIDCSTTISYDVREATGTAVLTQTYVVHLRTRRLARRTAYELDCTGPVILELPANASGVAARSIGASGQEVPRHGAGACLHAPAVGGPDRLPLPRVAPGIAGSAEATRTLSCR